ncbi:MAG: NAD-binding protein [Candidatus Accumulibacter sp.]|nr:NAD-binding protein [Accumulibacter sp.]
MQVGFIGLGVMGRPMALHLLRAGHRLAVWARRPEAVEPLRAAGAEVCATAAAVARQSTVTFTVLTADADLEQVVLGSSGLLSGWAAGSVLVDMGTMSPALTCRLAQELAQSGVDMLDAPVSGGEQGAIDATLAIMVGGQAAVLERVRPLLARLGKTIVHIGDHGAGQVAKACNQLIMVGAIQAIAEALHLSRAAGVDPRQVRQALSGGSAASRVLELMGRRMIDRDFAAGVEARLHHKDFRIIGDEAYRLAAPLPVSAQVAQQLNALVAKGWGGCDTSALLRVLESVAGER